MLEVNTEDGHQLWINIYAILSAREGDRPDLSVVFWVDGSYSTLQTPVADFVKQVRKEMATVARGISGLRVQ